MKDINFVHRKPKQPCRFEINQKKKAVSFRCHLTFSAITFLSIQKPTKILIPSCVRIGEKK